MAERCGQLLILLTVVTILGLVLVPRLADAAPSQGRTRGAEHAIAGEVTKIDDAAKTVVIRTADGIEETVRFTERTSVRGFKDVASLADAGARGSVEGASAVIRYTGEGAEKTAVSVKGIGKRTLAVAKGTIVRVDEGGKFVVVKTENGTEETYRLAKDAVVDSSRGVEEAGGATLRTIKHGTEATVHYSEEGGAKIVHLLKHL